MSTEKPKHAQQFMLKKTQFLLEEVIMLQQEGKASPGLNLPDVEEVLRYTFSSLWLQVNGRTNLKVIK